jgi:hypothetical protein
MKHPWYASGDLFLPSKVRKVLETYILGNDTSLFYITLWSFVHFISGIVFSFMSDSLQGYLVVHTIWELWQIYIRMTPIARIRGVIDVITDTCMGVLGFVVFKNE